MMKKHTFLGLLVAFSVLLTPFNALSKPKETDRQVLEVARNLLSNPGAENGKAKWSITGSSSLSLDTSTPLEGSTSLVWDASASGEFLRSEAITVPQGLKGRTCAVEMNYSWNSGVADEIELGVYDGTNTLAKLGLSPTDSTVPSRHEIVIFPCPSSGTLQLQLESTADSAAITVDSGRLGKPSNLTAKSDATVYGSARADGATNCQWQIAQSTYAADFPADTDCNTYTVTGRVTNPSTKVPQIDLDSAPPGTYEIYVQGGEVLCSGSETPSYALIDGSGTNITQDFVNNTATTEEWSLAGVVSYTTAGDRSFKIRGACASSTMSLRNNNTLAAMQWVVKRYPLESENAVYFDRANRNVTASWIGATNCAWSGTSTSPASFAADGDCNDPTVTGPGAAPGTKIPAVVVNNIAANDVYKVTVNGFMRSLSSAKGCDFFISDGSSIIGSSGLSANDNIGSGTGTVVGVVFYSAAQASKTFELQYAHSDGANSCEVVNNNTDRRLTITVENLTQTVGGISFENMPSTSAVSGALINAARINCDGASTILDNPGTWIDSVGNISSGQCIVNFTAGLLPNDPICTVSGLDGSVAVIMGFQAAPTTSSVGVQCTTNAGANCSSINFELKCFSEK